MNSFVKNFLATFILSLGLFAFLGNGNVSEAQNTGCQIESASFRPSGIINNYVDSSPPIVYFDVQTENCNTLNPSNLLRVVFYSVDWQSSTLSQMEIHKTERFYMAPPSVTTNVYAQSVPQSIMSNQSDFSIPILLGEQGSENECAWNFNAALWGVGGSLVGPDSPPLFINPQINNLLNGGDIPDCMIFAKIYKSTVNNLSAGEELIFSYGDIDDPKLLYECSGDCDLDWSVLGPFCFSPNDPDNTNNGLVPYMGSCDLSSSTISVTTIDNGGSSGGVMGSIGEYSTAPLAPLPGFTGNPNLGQWLESLFTMLIVIAGILALIMIIVGGITYVTSESFGDKGKGKGYIMNAIAGLVLALGAWVILNTINPELAEDLNIKIPTATLTVDQQAFVDYEDEIETGQSFVLAGTFENPQTSPGLSNFLNNINAGNQITSINVNTSTNNMTITSTSGSSVQIPVTGLGANGVAEIGQGVEGDRKTPKGDWQITSDIRISQNENDAQTPRVGNFNMGPAFIGTNIRTPSGTIRGVGIHGNRNNTPGVTMGCVRIKNDDVLALARKINSGVSLTIN